MSDKPKRTEDLLAQDQLATAQYKGLFNRKTATLSTSHLRAAIKQTNSDNGPKDKSSNNAGASQRQGDAPKGE
ncbi:MAG TPA: hypothetical protein VFS41_01920 [Edaphobacter sp.]|nr:hypothetical protein [Edaphobacter sp.]